MRVDPMAAMWHKDFGSWSVEKRAEFAHLLERLSRLLGANGGGDATVHDDMAVWFRNLFFTTDPRFVEACGDLPRFLRARLWRLYTLCWAAEQGTRATLEETIVDIGTYDGRALEVVLRYLRFTPQVYAFDLFDGVPLEARKSGHGPGLHEEVVRRLEPWDAKVYPGDIRQTLQHLPDTIAFAQIDLNDAEAESVVFPAVYERLLPGSVVVFDDYGFRRYRKSAEVHQRFLGKREQVLELPTGQGLLVKA